jgi:hypothetical protein
MRSSLLMISASVLLIAFPLLKLLLLRSGVLPFPFSSPACLFRRELSEATLLFSLPYAQSPSLSGFIDNSCP